MHGVFLTMRYLRLTFPLFEFQFCLCLTLGSVVSKCIRVCCDCSSVVIVATFQFFVQIVSRRLYCYSTSVVLVVTFRVLPRKCLELGPWGTVADLGV